MDTPCLIDVWKEMKFNFRDVVMSMIVPAVRDEVLGAMATTNAIAEVSASVWTSALSSRAPDIDVSQSHSKYSSTSGHFLHVNLITRLIRRTARPHCNLQDLYINETELANYNVLRYQQARDVLNAYPSKRYSSDVFASPMLEICSTGVPVSYREPRAVTSIVGTQRLCKCNAMHATSAACCEG